MPKVGLKAAEWKERLHRYARGTFVFGSGQKPSPRSRWGKELAAINSCPRHKSSCTTDVLGKTIACQCGCHDPITSSSRPGSASSSQAHQSTVQPTSSTSQAVTSHMTLVPTPTLPIPPVQRSTSSALPRMNSPSRSPSPCGEGASMLPTQQRATPPRQVPSKRSSSTAGLLVPSEQPSTSAQFLEQSSMPAPPASPLPKQPCQDPTREQASSEQPSASLSEEVSCYYDKYQYLLTAKVMLD